MKKKIFFVFIIAIIMIAAAFSSCTPEEIPHSGKITPPPATQNEEPSQTLSEWQIYAEQTLPEYIPAEDLMQSAEYTALQLSYDGSKLFYRHITDTTNSIEIMDIKTGKISVVPWPKYVTGVPHFYVTPDNNKVILLIDDQGDENYGLYLADVRKQETSEIMKAGEFDCMFLGFDKSNDDECFIGIFDDTPGVESFHIFRFNIKKETFRPIMGNTGDIINWEFDSQGRLVLLTTIDENAGTHIWLRNDLDSTTDKFRKEEWTNIFTWNYEDADPSGIIGIDGTSENILLIDSSVANLISVVNYNIATGEKTIISQDSEGTYDPYGVWLDAQTGDVTGVSYLRERLEWEALDESFGRHLDVLKNVNDGEMHIIDSSINDEVWLLAYAHDTKSDDYFLYDANTMQAEFLFSSAPALDALEFAPMEPISYKSSDGLTIYGYATFPLNMEHEDLPMVILVHGGPWSRDTWGFNPEVQFFANRGYMVLQVNFRSSTGYGKDFMRAGDMEWGRKMHQDILDALDWAVKKGWADPDRVALYGASYGGYEALVGAAFTPEKFACAIDLFGPSSLLTFVNSQPPQWNSYAQKLYRSIGDPAKDAMLMMERSPYYRAEEISIPLMVVHGGNDVRVKQSESEQLVQAMRDADIDVEYLLFPNTGHGLFNMSDRITFYEAAEKFLAKHIGGRSRIYD